MSRKSANPDLVPPRLEEDALERKRVLNILAQRRYRKRKRERIQALESRGANHTEAPQAVPSAPATAQRESQTCHAQIVPVDSMKVGLGFTSFIQSADEAIQVNNQNPATIPIFPQTPSSDLTAMNPIYSKPLLDDLPFEDLIYRYKPALEWENQEYQDAMLSEPKNLFLDSLPSNLDSNFDISTELQNYDASFFNFPDDRMLEVPSLTLLNAAMKVAQRLNVTELIWDMTAISPFFQQNVSQSSSASLPSLDSLGSSPEKSSASSAQVTDLPEFEELPSHLQPTPTQRLVPHHPILDLLPWPGARDKLIQVFNLPIDMRPKSAQDQLGLVRLVYDMEDPGGEGVNIRGQDPFSPVEWEIGQLMFERWWWAFESSVVESSNCLRRKRGERALTF
ncbi:hypothetical protein PENARI_c006G00705 [Penicillium arizonense]|uniref:BZIP domain-containing protein n=1 Tax=Penicillium arizonense TaxID=1835702 RepID=A0A1F5LML6_PENAI|nr:hypothetical protein PENARI_c006G00705 [Penicillium arizonense]OGE54171.1 hypothetical protein PENARI_c006G00705 [Penicillium arizonense]